MELVKTGAVAGEGKAVTSDRSRSGEQAAASQEALIQWPAKPAIGERRGETSGALERSAQYRACRWWARLEIRSLGTICFWGRAHNRIHRHPRTAPAASPLSTPGFISTSGIPASRF